MVEDQHAAILDQIGADTSTTPLPEKEQTKILDQIKAASAPAKTGPELTAAQKAAILQSVSDGSQ